jgi:HSP20 family protein
MNRNTRRPRKGEQDDAAEIGLDFGLGGIFKGLGNFIQLLGEMAEEGREEITRTGEIKGPGRTRAMYGFTVKLGTGGAPQMERFGTIRAPKAGPVTAGAGAHAAPLVEEVREPVVDVFDEGETVVVIAEMPGVEESDVQFQIKQDILILSARHQERTYSKEVLLPCPVLADTAKAAYRNGIWEVRVAKAATSGEAERE